MRDRQNPRIGDRLQDPNQAPPQLEGCLYIAPSNTKTPRNAANMPTFGSKKFRPSSYNNSIPARYRAALAKHPFALFGLPFVGTMLLGSFFLTPATALRYERHDRKVKTMTEDEKLGIGKDRRRIDMKEEYYVSCCGFL
jgi:cytochrome c oxidase assembly protein subunit 16